MSHPLYVAFIWHQHQPLYRSRERADYPGKQYRLPWVRLHGTKDYLDLVLILERYPKLHQTVNLVPSLILQLEDYAAGVAMDPYLAVALTPEDRLSTGQKQFALQYFFDGNHHTLIDPHPRYAQLYAQRQEQGRKWCLENWQPNDYGDLLAWHNLSWIDPIFWDDAAIAGWLQKGKDFSLCDRQRIYSKQREIISRIVPQHRKMQETGQLEVTTTPYTHPILPLLADTDSGRVAVPEMMLPETRFQYPQDIPRHLQKAKALYGDRFGRSPRGLWPSEQSVSPAVLPDIAKAGFEWICSDEAVLGWTLQTFFHRDGGGNLCEPELLYRPYRLETPQGDLSIVFRDHRLSDLIGFTYGAMEPQEAAGDLVGHLESIAHSLKERQASGSTSLEQPWLVTIALDGENCWEYYQQDGLPFLESLYGTLSDREDLQLVTVAEFLDRFPATETLPAQQLHSGSWVDGNFTTWIGDPAKNRAWDLLAAARRAIAEHPEATEESNPEAWEALYAAEGSDWFWWFGEGHSSNHDDIFDRLFREHLAALYTALNLPVPPGIQREVERHEAGGDRRPQSFIHPSIDGVGDEQDWDKAGRIEVGGARGTMHRSSDVRRLFYGLDHQNFYFRFDFKAGIELNQSGLPELHLFWYYPDLPRRLSRIPFAELPDVEPANHLYHHHLGLDLPSGAFWFEEAGDDHQWYGKESRAAIGVNQCVELAVPWEDLNIEPDRAVKVVAVLAKDGKFQSHLPDGEPIDLQAP